MAPVEPKPQTSVPADPLKSIQDFGGQSDVSLFSGSMSFQYPLKLTLGRSAMTPQIALSYSSNERNFASLAGFGWNLTSSSIFRSTTHGLDQLYAQDHFTAEINGGGQELISIDQANGVYGAKIETDFTKYEQLAAGWQATSTDGTVYTFGTTANAQQSDPVDSTRIYKWLLERVEDRNGNYITYTYTHDQGQVYPATIRYTGHSALDDGLYEVRFVWEARSPYTEYRRGFPVTTAKRLASIELYRTDTNALIYQYDLAYAPRSGAVKLISSITQRSGADSLPATSFDYYDGSESVPGQRIDLLKQISYPYGASETFIYEPSTVPRSNGQAVNPLPFVIHTLKERQLQPEPSGPVFTTQYDYAGGHYYFDPADAYKKEYGGFHQVTVTDPLGNVTENFFHQSEFSIDGSTQGEVSDHLSKKGRPYLIEIQDDNGTVLQRQWSHWVHQSLADDDADRDRFGVTLTESITVDYGPTQTNARATAYQYDSYGNTTEEMDYGEVSLNDGAGNYTDVGTDSVSTTYEYAQNTAIHLVNKPWRIKQFDHAGTMVARTRFYYDNLNTDPDIHNLTKGNETRRKVLASQGPNVNLISNFGYNALGQINSATDAEGNTTTWSYDSLKLQPKDTTNALGHVTDFVYDLRFGQLSQTTDPNGLVMETDYDAFGRPVAVRQSDPVSPASLVTISTTAYDDTSYPASITNTVMTGVNGIEAVGVRYLDGLGRLIQTRQEAAGADFSVTDLEYDERGQQAVTYLPEFQAGSAYQTANQARPKVTTTFDALNRPLAITDPTGITQHTYDGWSTEITNKLGQTKTLHHDAFDRLASVDETLAGQTLTTSYQYDDLGNLVLLTDALGNTRAHSYDMAGRRLSQGQWRKTGAPTLATTFTYDSNGNVLTQTDPRGQSITYTYDDLNRPLTETSSAGTNTYSYDTALNGIGRLASVAVPGLTKAFSYDIAGRPTSESHTIGTENFLTQRSFDWRGQLVGITTPDGLNVTYGLDNAGQVNTVTSGTDTIASAIEYGPHGHISRVMMGNGVETINTFDPQQLHRLTSKVTTLGASTLQDLSYTLDAEGNVTGLVEAGSTDAARTASYGYDDLQRLTTATITNAANGQNYTRSYAYDVIGNLTSRSDLGTSTFYENHPHLVSSDSTGTTYSYDAAGNLTGDGTWTHTWDAHGRLSNSTDGSTTVSYQYDESGQRFAKIAPTDSTLYVGKTFERDDNASRTHVFVRDLKLATKTTDLTPQ